MFVFPETPSGPEINAALERAELLVAYYRELVSARFWDDAQDGAFAAMHRDNAERHRLALLALGVLS